MKNLLTTLFVYAALIIFLIVNDSVYSQNVISSVSTAKNATIVSKALKNSNSETNELNRDVENWMSNRNYLDINSSDFNLLVIAALNEKIDEQNKELEEWMFEEAEWIIPESNLELITGDEIMLEEWMFDSFYWKLPEENKSNIENWMLDKEFWILHK